MFISTIVSCDSPKKRTQNMPKSCSATRFYLVRFKTRIASNVKLKQVIFVLSIGNFYHSSLLISNSGKAVAILSNVTAQYAGLISIARPRRDRF